MERFVRFVVAGGVALVAGLWLTALFATLSPPWLLGVALAVAGSGALAYGTGIELETGPLAGR